MFYSCMLSYKNEDKIYIYTHAYVLQIVIISDSNSLLVSHLLEKWDIAHLIDRVMTNVASLDGDLITVKPFHVQEECNKSYRNLCKAKVNWDIALRRLHIRAHASQSFRK